MRRNQLGGAEVGGDPSMGSVGGIPGWGRGTLGDTGVGQGGNKRVPKAGWFHCVHPMVWGGEKAGGAVRTQVSGVVSDENIDIFGVSRGGEQSHEDFPVPWQGGS